MADYKRKPNDREITMTMDSEGLKFPDGMSESEKRNLGVDVLPSDRKDKVVNIKDNSFRFSIRPEGTYEGHAYGNAFCITGPGKFVKESGMHKLDIPFLTIVRFLKWANDPVNKAEVMKYYNIEKEKIVVEGGY